MLKWSKYKLAVLAVLATVIGGCGDDVPRTPSPTTGNQPRPGYYPQSGCIPISTTIPFTGNGVQFSSTVIKAGQIPPSSFSLGETVGVVTLGGAATAGGQYSRSGVDGTISLNVYQGSVPYGGQTVPPTNQYPTTPYAGAGGLNGVLTIASATQQDIVNQFGSAGTVPNQGFINPAGGTQPVVQQPGYYPYNGGTCVSGIALDLKHYNNIIYSGFVYLYLNNTAHGYVLYF